MVKIQKRLLVFLKFKKVIFFFKNFQF